VAALRALHLCDAWRAKRIAREVPFAPEPNDRASEALTSVAAMPAWNFTLRHADDLDDLIARWGERARARRQWTTASALYQVAIAQNWRSA
jgi:hypothetical protein